MTDHIKTITEHATALSLGAGRVSERAAETRIAIDAIRDEKKTTDAARALFYLKQAHKDLDDARKQFYHLVDFLEKGVVPEMLENDGVDMVRIPDIGRSFSKQNKMSASFIDKDAGFEWLRGQGHGDIITETVNAQTLSAFVRNLILEEGIDPPEDIVKVSQYNTTSMTKYTPK